MAQVELIMPKMGESIMEATILKWVKKVGDTVDLDETILEIATDKVDSEIPSPVAGKITQILFKEDDVVEIGKVIAMIETEGASDQPVASSAQEVSVNGNGMHNDADDTPQMGDQLVKQDKSVKKEVVTAPPQPAIQQQAITKSPAEKVMRVSSQSGRFYSPLVRNMAQQEGIPITELDLISGSGHEGRVTKDDMLQYLKQRKAGVVSQPQVAQSTPTYTAPVTSMSGADEIIEMDRMRRLIADHMVMSKRTSPHVTSYVEADVTNIVEWRNKVKGTFQKNYGEKITYTPIFIEAVTRALRDFPMVNVSVDGTKIIVKKNINIGMATALPTGNLIVPVIPQADQLNLIGLTKAVNDLANRARNNKLKPEEIQGGTFTLTNVGTFGNVMGTPIINQPQVAILAVGAIRKKPAVVETEYGDLIAIRQMMYLSLSYDHRVVDGVLGGSFLRRIADYMEAFDKNQSI
jgi:2-oxoglutarate dehydrogenase E2 component (dihydrolipoamide succinyltransferase)